MGVLDVGPLDFLVVTIEVFEFVLHVGLPSDVIINDRDRLVRSLREKLVGVVEDTLRDKTARESSCIFVQLGSIDRCLTTQVFVGLDGVAVVERADLEVVSHELFVAAGLDVAAMVLVEVVELVVDVDGGGDVAINHDIHGAR